MDPEAPGEPGGIDDAETGLPPGGRTTPAKKSLDQFLAEFEANLRERPGEPATTASAALEGRAEGAWRTPVEGAERTGRRLLRRPPWRRPGPATQPPGEAPDPSPAAVEPPAEPFGPAGETLVQEPEQGTEPAPVEVASAGPTVAAPADATIVSAPDAGSAAVEPAPSEVQAAARRRRRHRHGRRHR